MEYWKKYEWMHGSIQRFCKYSTFYIFKCFQCQMFAASLIIVLVHHLLYSKKCSSLPLYCCLQTNAVILLAPSWQSAHSKRCWFEHSRGITFSLPSYKTSSLWKRSSRWNTRFVKAIYHNEPGNKLKEPHCSERIKCQLWSEKIDQNCPRGIHLRNELI